MKRVDIKAALRDPAQRKALIDNATGFLCALEGHQHMDRPVSELQALLESKPSLHDVDVMYRRGVISTETTQDFIELWNRGPHYTEAYLADGMIRQRTK